MLTSRPSKRRTNQGVSTRMKARERPRARSAPCAAARRARARSSRSDLGEGYLWSTIAVVFLQAPPPPPARSRPAASGRFETNERDPRGVSPGDTAGAGQRDQREANVGSRAPEEIRTHSDAAPCPSRFTIIGRELARVADGVTVPRAGSSAPITRCRLALRGEAAPRERRRRRPARRTQTMPIPQLKVRSLSPSRRSALGGRAEPKTVPAASRPSRESTRRGEVVGQDAGNVVGKAAAGDVGEAPSARGHRGVPRGAASRRCASAPERQQRRPSVSPGAKGAGASHCPSPSRGDDAATSSE